MSLQSHRQAAITERNLHRSNNKLAINVLFVLDSLTSSLDIRSVTFNLSSAQFHAIEREKLLLDLNLNLIKISN